ncbi:hypothetical protein J0895_21845 [Phormidium pseudopriestleyi FRX01]|uniref:DUF5895 domain-containing protein n=1 Tax=Phormidium pseudopriestleyi FRX01 TaxID=1759528 RepID=A0ABS3FX21_9CYAN|nr:DUF5895 domain-containing protein [Phormidium pseudopriestleyi]MBO0351675.1 hypothetical protein [Phormidium pseudopriestleyi FRX01]
MTSTMNPSPTFDFEDEKFKAPPSKLLPWCQMINPRLHLDGLKPYGLAVKLDQAKASGFTPDENWQPVEHEFSTGDVETLLMTTTPRLLIIRQGPICLKDRVTGDIVGRLMDFYDAFKADRLKYKPFTRYLIFFIGQNQKLLHQTPLRLTLSGSAGAGFGMAYRYGKTGTVTGFTAELEQAYADFRRQPYTPKGSLFHAHGIFCPTFEAVEKGKGNNTAWVADTSDYEHPTASNLADYMIPSNSEESALICETFEEYNDFGEDIPKVEVPKVETATPPSTLDSNADAYEDEFEYPEPPY